MQNNTITACCIALVAIFTATSTLALTPAPDRLEVAPALVTEVTAVGAARQVVFVSSLDRPDEKPRTLCGLVKSPAEPEFWVLVKDRADVEDVTVTATHTAHSVLAQDLRDHLLAPRLHGSL